jgi:hypothetical protein
MDTRKEVLFVLIQEYADWEFALLAPGRRGLAYGNRDTKSEPWLPMRGR